MLLRSVSAWRSACRVSSSCISSSSLSRVAAAAAD
jgi:hypothetical protein